MQSIEYRIVLFLSFAVGAQVNPRKKLSVLTAI